MRHLSSLKYVPLIAVTLVSVVYASYSYEAYSSSYATLHEFTAFVEDVAVSYGQAAWVNTTFVLYNPSSTELLLTYLQETVYLNSSMISLESSFISKYMLQQDYVIKLSPHSNSTFRFDGQVKTGGFPTNYNQSAGNQWNYVLLMTLDDVPLLKIASLYRYASFETGSTS